MSGIKNNKDWQSNTEKTSKKQFRILIKEIMDREEPKISN